MNLRLESVVRASTMQSRINLVCFLKYSSKVLIQPGLRRETGSTVYTHTQEREGGRETGREREGGGGVACLGHCESEELQRH